MGYFISFALIAIQLTTALASQPIPLKCFLQEPIFMGIFNKTSGLAKSYAFPSKNPLHFDSLKVDPISFEQDGLILEAKDLEVRGLQDMILDRIEFNFESNYARVTLHTDIFATSRYRVGGSLFSLPIEGDGSYIGSLKNVQVYVIMPFDIVDANGVKVIDLQSYTYWYDVKDNAEFNFTNLYNGNKELSDSMHRLINENWKLLTVQFGSHFFNKIVSYMFNEFKNYVLDMPLREFSSC